MKGDKMKKLLIVLLVVALAAFLLVGCNPVTPVEGEGEPQVGATVAITDSVVVDGKTYVSAGDHTITVTFPAAVVGLVTANITACGGDYSKDKLIVTVNAPVVLFPDATKKIWTGSGTFTASSSECCASYVEVTSGECTSNVCIAFPVIIDGCPPYALIDISVDNCTCAGCAVTFTSTSTTPLCAEGELCCGDDCSGLASWAINIYDGNPFDTCCDPSVCEEPVATCSGVACPIECTTACLVANSVTNPYYYAVVTLADKVGLEATYYARITLSHGTTPTDTCSIVVVEGTIAAAPTCVTWDTDTTDTIGTCTPTCGVY
jgi:predicted small secreted protein